MLYVTLRVRANFIILHY